VREVLRQTGRASVRERDLPAHVVVYYVIALALYMRSSYGPKNSNVADVTCYAPPPSPNFGPAALRWRDLPFRAGEQLRLRLSFWTLRAGEAAIFYAHLFTQISFLWYNVIGCLVVIATALAITALAPHAAGQP
jgi:hypothetical protein